MQKRKSILDTSTKSPAQIQREAEVLAEKKEIVDQINVQEEQDVEEYRKILMEKDLKDLKDILNTQRIAAAELLRNKILLCKDCGFYQHGGIDLHLVHDVISMHQCTCKDIPITGFVLGRRDCVKINTDGKCQHHTERK